MAGRDVPVGWFGWQVKPHPPRPDGRECDCGGESCKPTDPRTLVTNAEHPDLQIQVFHVDGVEAQQRWASRVIAALRALDNQEVTS